MPNDRPLSSPSGSAFARIRRGVISRLARARDRALVGLLNTVDRLAGSGFPPPDEERRHALAASPDAMGVAFVGCGFVADFYARTLAQHPELRLIGVFDREPSRAQRLAARLGVQAFEDLATLLNDPRVELALNLTNPGSHYAISKACLEAGKHVYSEKPLATTLAEAEELVAIAERQGRILSGAPCSVLGGAAQALAEAINCGVIGPVRLVYAELDDGPIHQMQPQDWQSPRGTPWPWKDEFAVGCTLEHAGYYLSWLVSLFGPADSVTGFAAKLTPDKHPEIPESQVGPDFSVGCVRFQSGVVARLTCGIVAPHDHSLRIIGDRGVLTVEECWHNAAPVRLSRFSGLTLRAATYPWAQRSSWIRHLFGLSGKLYPGSPKSHWRLKLRRHDMDYLLGPSEVAQAARANRPCRLSGQLALHVTEIALAIRNAAESEGGVRIRSTLEEFPLAAAIIEKPTRSTQRRAEVNDPLPLRVMLIGGGGASQRRLIEPLRSLERAQALRVCALIESDRSAAERIRQSFPAAVWRRELGKLASSAVDAVLLALPPEQQAAPLRWAQDAGCPVLCEPPVGDSTQETEALLAGKSGAQPLIAAALPFRFLTSTEVIASLIKSGDLGSIQSFHWQETGELDRLAGNHGVLRLLGLPALDLLRDWFGDPTDFHYADDSMGGVEANSRLRLHYFGGLHGELRLSGDWLRSNQLTIRGSKGWVRWRPKQSDDLELGGADLPASRESLLAKHGAAPGRAGVCWRDGALAQLRNFIGAIGGAEELRAPAQRLLPILRFIDRCHQQRQPLAAPWFSDREVEKAKALARRTA